MQTAPAIQRHQQQDTGALAAMQLPDQSEAVSSTHTVT